MTSIIYSILTKFPFPLMLKLLNRWFIVRFIVVCFYLPAFFSPLFPIPRWASLHHLTSLIRSTALKRLIFPPHFWDAFPRFFLFSAVHRHSDQPCLPVHWASIATLSFCNLFWILKFWMFRKNSNITFSVPRLPLTNSWAAPQTAALLRHNNLQSALGHCL